MRMLLKAVSSFFPAGHALPSRRTHSDMNIDYPKLMTALKKSREAFHEQCRRDTPGILGARTYARELISILAKAINDHGKGWCLAAVGGLGRGSLSFFSDLDLLVLHEKRLDQELRTFVQDLVQSLWDAGFEVGHVVSSVSGLKKLMSSDFSALTTYLETEFVGGDRHLYRSWRHSIENGQGMRTRRHFLNELVEGRTSRAKRSAESTYILEPNLKEGLGGLRDLHALRWCGVRFNASPDYGDMVERGWISAIERQWVEQTEDFLWRVRLQLHVIRQRKQDQMSLEDQTEVAGRLGFVDGTEGVSAVEVFMRQHYRATSRVRRVADFLQDRLYNQLAPARTRRKQKVLDGPVLFDGEYLSFHDPDLLASNPGLLMLFFRQMAETKGRIHHETGQIIRDHLGSFTPQWQERPEVIEHFFAILLNPDMAYTVLKVMMETGFLEVFLPEFTSIRYRVQFDVYHVYTVDEHLLRTVRFVHEQLQELQAGNSEQARSIDIPANEMSKERILFLAALLHDIGKGRGHGHAERGAQMMGGIAQRLHLSDDETDLLSFLIRHHLVLAETALKRDLADEKPIERCAMIVENRERLDMLFLLTVSDSKATGSQVWTTWRRSLINELYVKVKHVLQQEDWLATDIKEQVRDIKALLDSEFPEPSLASRARDWLEKLSVRYLLTQPPEAVIRHFRLELELEESPLVFKAEACGNQMWALTIVCPDHPVLFDLITGVLWANGINVLSADIYTRSYGVAVDILLVDSVPDPLRVNELWDRVRSDLTTVLRDDAALEGLLKRKQTWAPVNRTPVVRKDDRVVIDENASDFYTVIEVYTWERPGVLHTISKVLHSFDLSIKVAKITTPGAQVVDVFYVTNSFGDKVLESKLHTQLKESLLQALTTC